MAALALSLAAVFSAPAVQAQAPVPDGSRAESANDPALPPIRIDAIVIDSKQRPVRNLGAADFELRLDGATHPIGSVELHAPTAGVAIPAVEDDRRSSHRGARVFAFVLDEFHVSPGEETARVREAVTRFVDEQLRPADRAVVLKPLDQVNAIRFTGDRDVLREAIASFEGRKGDFAPRTAFEEQFIGHAPATVAAARVQLVTVALNELAMQLGELDAERAAVVFVSEGFARAEPVRRGARIIDLRGLLRAASRFHFPVYTFNPADAATGADKDGARDPAPATLEWLAVQTGGAAVLDGQRLAAGLARMAGELDAYYTLTVPGGPTDGRFHEIELHVKRPGVSVRVRPGYWAPLSSEVREWLRRTTAPAARTPRRALKRSTLIDVWVGLVPVAGGQRQMMLTWEPTAQRPGSKTPEPARIDVTARASGETLFHGTLSPAGEPGASAEIARFDVPAGLVEIDMRVLAPDGALLDSDIRDMHVPDLARENATITLSPQIVRARTMIEFRAAVKDPAAVPTNARTFSRTERLVIRLPAWGPGGAAVQTGVRVLNRTGQLIRALEPAGTPAGLPQYELPLYWLAPGEYYLEFSGRSGDLETRDRLAIRITG